MTLEELKQKLREEPVVKFSFHKKDDSVRTTVATINEFLIPQNKLSKENEQKQNESNLKFYDVEKQGWRSLVYDCSTIQLEEINLKPWEELIKIVKNKRETDKK